MFERCLTKMLVIFVRGNKIVVDILCQLENFYVNHRSRSKHNSLKCFYPFDHYLSGALKDGPYLRCPADI